LRKNAGYFALQQALSGRGNKLEGIFLAARRTDFSAISRASRSVLRAQQQGVGDLSSAAKVRPASAAADRPSDARASANSLGMNLHAEFA
jgi:hypothetical protein